MKGILIDSGDLAILKMINAGFSHQEIAASFEYSFRKYYNFYVGLLIKTKCWDDIELCAWWNNNKNVYLDGKSGL